MAKTRITLYSSPEDFPHSLNRPQLADSLKGLYPRLAPYLGRWLTFIIARTDTLDRNQISYDLGEEFGGPFIGSNPLQSHQFALERSYIHCVINNISNPLIHFENPSQILGLEEMTDRVYSSALHAFDILIAGKYQELLFLQDRLRKRF